MPEVPKIVHERLRVAGNAQGDTHPDPNVLTAFAEQALSAAERENVLTHLSGCDECRELLAVRSPDLEVVPAAVAAEPAEAAPGRGFVSRRRSWFAWNRLGWAGLAAGVAITFAVLVTRPPKQKTFEEARQNSASAPSPEATPPVVAMDADKTNASLPSSKPAATIATQPAAPSAATRRDELKKLAAPPAPSQESVVVENKIQASAAKKDVPSEFAFNTSAPRPGSTTESVEVAGTAAQVSSAQTTDTLSANEAAPVMRAKAARVTNAPVALAKAATINTKQADVKQEQAEISNGLPASSSDARQLPLAGGSAYVVVQRGQVTAQWRIRSDEVERSLDSGAHWESAFQPHRALLSVAAGNSDVWAGGKGGVLYHSANSGLSWTEVHPTIRGQALAGDIIHIDLNSSTNIALSTSKNETWDTNDGGTTWEKK